MKIFRFALPEYSEEVKHQTIEPYHPSHKTPRDITAFILFVSCLVLPVQCIVFCRNHFNRFYNNFPAWHPVWYRCNCNVQYIIYCTALDSHTSTGESHLPENAQNLVSYLYFHRIINQLHWHWIFPIHI